MRLKRLSGEVDDLIMHMVTYRSTDGSPAFHQADALEEAVRFVEQLTNEARGSEARIFSMAEVPIAVKTYYRVEIAAADAPAPEVAPAPEEPVAVAAATVEAVKGGGEAVANGSAAGGGRFGLFSKA